MSIWLNGWQRLWIVITSIYLTLVVLVGVLLVDNVYSNYPDPETCRNVQAHTAEPGNPTATRIKLLAECSELGGADGVQRAIQRSLAHLGLGLLGVWLVPVLLLYVLGLSVGWVRKGFGRH